MTVKLTWKNAAVGWYQPEVQANGMVKWDVKVSKDGTGFLCARQEDAEIMSMLVRIMEKLGIEESKDYFEEAERKKGKEGK